MEDSLQLNKDITSFSPACGFQNHAQGLQFPVPCSAEPTEARGSCFKVSQVGAGGTTSSRKFTEGGDKGGGTGGSEVAESSGAITEELDPI